MTLEEEYRQAKAHLREINELTNMTTLKARQRIAAHNLRTQLEMHMADLKKEFAVSDQADVETAFAADKAWTERNAALRKGKGWEPTS